MRTERYCVHCGDLPPVQVDIMTVEQWETLFHGLPKGCYAAPPEPGLPADAHIDGYCRDCQRRMCPRHWIHAVIFDNGHYDGMDAICPYGHRFADVAR